MEVIRMDHRRHGEKTGISSPIRKGGPTIRLVKRPAEDVKSAAASFGMGGWASSAARELDDPELPMFAIEHETEGIVGQAGLKIWGSRSAATIALFDPKLRGRGIGTLVMRMLVAYGFCILDLPRIRIRVEGSNRAALSCYHKVGFVIIKWNDDGSMLMEAQRESWLTSYGADAQKLANSIGSWAD